MFPCTRKVSSNLESRVSVVHGDHQVVGPLVVGQVNRNSEAIGIFSERGHRVDEVDQGAVADIALSLLLDAPSGCDTCKDRMMYGTPGLSRSHSIEMLASLSVS
jgi:hypothetical protein